MPTTPAPAPDALRECAAAFARAVSAIRDDQLGSRTPCEKFTVAELLGHLGEVLPSSARAARKEQQPGTGPQTSSGEGPEAAATDPQAVARAAEQAAAAWGEPGAYEGETEFGPGQMPAGLAATITLQELALHGWDLARATGAPFALSDAAAEAALGAAEQLVEGGARTSGAYGPPASVPAGAPAWQRALATSGRNPEWSA